MWLHKVKPKSEYSFYKPRFESICLYTYSVPHLERWLRKNHIFVGRLTRWAKVVDHERRITEVTIHFTNKLDRELIIKEFGYYDPEYDHLDFIGRLKFKYGQFHKFKHLETDYV